MKLDAPNFLMISVTGPQAAWRRMLPNANANGDKSRIRRQRKEQIGKRRLERQGPSGREERNQ